MADKEKGTAKVEATASASEETQAPASGTTASKVQNENGVKAKVNPKLGVTSVSFPDGEGGVDTFSVEGKHTVSRELLEVKNVNGEPYFVEVKEEN